MEAIIIDFNEKKYYFNNITKKFYEISDDFCTTKICNDNVIIYELINKLIKTFVYKLLDKDLSRLISYTSVDNTKFCVIVDDKMIEVNMDYFPFDMNTIDPVETEKVYIAIMYNTYKYLLEKFYNKNGNTGDNDNLMFINNRIYYYNMIENCLFYVEDLKTSIRTEETDPKIINKYKHQITNKFIINNIEEYSKLYNNKNYKYRFDTNQINSINKNNVILVFEYSTDKLISKFEFNQNLMNVDVKRLTEITNVNSEKYMSMMQYKGTIELPNNLKEMFDKFISKSLEKYVKSIYLEKLANWAMGAEFYIKFDNSKKIKIPYVRFMNFDYIYSPFSASLVNTNEHIKTDNINIMKYNINKIFNAFVYKCYKCQDDPEFSYNSSNIFKTLNKFSEYTNCTEEYEKLDLDKYNIIYMENNILFFENKVCKITFDKSTKIVKVLYIPNDVRIAPQYFEEDSVGYDAIKYIYINKMCAFKDPSINKSTKIMFRH